MAPKLDTVDRLNRNMGAVSGWGILRALFSSGYVLIFRGYFRRQGAVGFLYSDVRRKRRSAHRSRWLRNEVTPPEVTAATYDDKVDSESYSPRCATFLISMLFNVGKHPTTSIDLDHPLSNIWVWGLGQGAVGIRPVIRKKMQAEEKNALRNTHHFILTDS